MAYGEAMTGSSPSVFALVEAMTRAGTTAAAESRVFYTTFASVHEQVRPLVGRAAGFISLWWSRLAT